MKSDVHTLRLRPTVGRIFKKNAIYIHIYIAKRLRILSILTTTDVTLILSQATSTLSLYLNMHFFKRF